MSARTTSTARTDAHRPGAIVPSAYTYLESYALPGGAMGADGECDEGYNADEARAITDDARKSGHAVFGDLGKCGVCGAAFRYGDIWLHTSGEFVHLGHDCAHKYSLVANRKGFDAALEMLKARRAAFIEGQKRAAIREAFLKDHPGLAEALTVDHRITADLSANLTKWGKMSDKQIALAFKLQEDAKNPPPAREEIPKGGFVGTIGKRETFELTLHRVISFEKTPFNAGRYGAPDVEFGYIYLMRADDGSDVVYFGSSPPCNKPTATDAGNGVVAGGPIRVKVKATVKSQGDRKGRPQTVVQRPAFVWPAGMPKSWDEKWEQEKAREAAALA